MVGKAPMGVLPALNLWASTGIKEAVQTVEQEIKDIECSLCVQILTTDVGQGKEKEQILYSDP